MDAGTVGGKQLGYGYDGHGRRVSRTAGTVRTDYWHDMTGMALESSTTGGPTATYLRDPGGRPLSSSVNGTHFLNYGTDRLGSVTANTDGSGNLANSYARDAWGEQLQVSGQTYQALGYAGTYQDHDAGLYQMSARWYGSGMGRFTQQDPLPSSVLEANRYEYANSSPCNYTDPTGLFPKPSCVSASMQLGFGLAQFASLYAGAPSWVFRGYKDIQNLTGAMGILLDGIHTYTGDGRVTGMEVMEIVVDALRAAFDLAINLSGIPDAAYNTYQGIRGVAKGCFGKNLPDPVYPLV